MNTDVVINRSTDKTAQKPQARRARKVKANIVSVDQISIVEQERMYSIFSKYYINHNKETFLKDLFEKNDVILLRDIENKTIQGFSTLLKVNLKQNGTSVTGIFSGDTVLEKEYWGNKALGVAFLQYLWMEKIKNPLKPVYWFLMSKGYKTYLLMANNFKTHYPRHESKTPSKYKNLIDAFYSARFPDYYNPSNGLIEFDSHSCSLKEKIAEVTPELLSNPRVRFFAENNPQWERGFELACLAEMTMLMPIQYILKKTFQKRTQK